MCESWLHDSNTFITLTYNDDNLPIGSLASKDDIQRFIKRLRHASRDYSVGDISAMKYYITSEYGDKFGRPHYHGVLFGVNCLAPDWQPYFVRLNGNGYPVYSSRVLESIWSNGFVSVDEVNMRDIRYITKYITKDRDLNFQLYSRGLGKRLFFDEHNNLTAFCNNAFVNGFIVYPQGNGKSFKGRIPKNIDRYLSIYEPSFYDVVRETRSYFARHSKNPTAAVVSDAVEGLKIKQRQEQEKRILDNET